MLTADMGRRCRWRANGRLAEMELERVMATRLAQSESVSGLGGSRSEGGRGQVGEAASSGRDAQRSHGPLKQRK